MEAGGGSGLPARGRGRERAWGLGGWRGGEGRAGALDSRSPRLAGCPGYPNEAAAEIVLATLREWLEQHKDKVSPGPIWGGPRWGGGVHPGPLTSPASHRREQGRVALCAPSSPLGACGPLLGREPGELSSERAGGGRGRHGRRALAEGALAQVDRLIICVFLEKDEAIYRQRLPHYFPVGTYWRCPARLPAAPTPRPRPRPGQGLTVLCLPA